MQDPAVSLIASQRADLLAFLARVGGDDWSKPTVCDPWTFKDVLAHMVEGELNVGKIYRGEVREQGYIDPEEGIAKWRPLPGEALRASLWQHGVATQRVLEAMSEDVWRAPIKAFGCREVRQLVRLHAFDVSVHGHDLTDALDAGPLWRPALRFLTEFVVRAAPPTLRRRGLEPSGVLDVTVGERRWLIDGRSGEWRVDHDPGAAGDAATIGIEAEDLVLLTTGRAPNEEELLARAKIAGDLDQAKAILGAWRVV
jgi:uncharacterized protein (TIGR03083 family)